MTEADELFSSSALVPAYAPVSADKFADSPAVTALRASLSLDRCRTVPYAHQVVGAKFIIDHPFVGVFDEPGAGKTFQTIIAAVILYLLGVIKRVIIVAPAPVRPVWADYELGELSRHLWKTGIDSEILEYHSYSRAWKWIEGEVIPTPRGAIATPDPKRMQWIVTNYEFIRSKKWLTELLSYATRDTLLVGDEAHKLKTWNSEQTKAFRELRKRVGRVLLLTGTPIANDPMDLFSLGNILSPSILDCKFITHFQARYAVMGGYMVETKWGKKIPTQVLRWQHLDDIQKRFAPYVIRRLKKDCLDLPPKLPPTTLRATLKASWPHYKAMRDDMVTWLNDSHLSIADKAPIKAMRLAQIASGFLGGITEETFEEEEMETLPDWAPDELFDLVERTPEQRELEMAPTSKLPPSPVQFIGREKLDVFIDWLDTQLEADPNLKLIVQCRFRPELARVVSELRTLYRKMEVGEIRGGQKERERADAKKLMDPRFAPSGPATVVMTNAGNEGVTLVASHTVFRLSRSYVLLDWKQGEERVHRPGQTSPVSYTDCIAEGPKGQKTVDAVIYKALLAKENVAAWTTGAWVTRLLEE